MFCKRHLFYNTYKKRRDMQEITVGKIYKHYKGNFYKIIAIAKHSETKEEMIVYKNTEKGDIWVRPKYMWNEKIDKNTLRFSLVD